MRIKQKKYLFIVIAIFSNFIFFYLGLEPNGLTINKLFKESGDSIDYVDVSEKIIKGEDFTFFKTNDDHEYPSNFVDPNTFNKEIFYSFRTPGFSFIYVPLRLLFSQENTIYIFLLLQIVLGGLCKYLISSIGEKVFNSTKVFYVTYFLLLTTPLFSQFNNLLLTDSLGSSLLIFSSYYFLESWESDSKRFNKNLFYSGLFLTIAVFLRPFLAVFFVPLGIYILWTDKSNFIKLIATSLSFTVIFILIDGAWIVRNKIKTDAFIPLASTMKFQEHKNKAFFEIKEISSRLALPMNWWDKDSPVHWYTSDGKSDINAIFKGLTSDNLNQKIIESRNLFNKSNSNLYTREDRQGFETDASAILLNVKNEIKENSPFNYYFSCKAELLFDFLNQPNLRLYHNWKYPFNLALVFAQSLVQKSISFLGFFLAISLIIFSRIDIKLKIFIGSSVFLTFLFTFEMLFCEHREISTFYPFFLLAMVGGVSTLVKRSKLWTIPILLIFGLVIHLSYSSVLNEINW